MVYTQTDSFRIPPRKFRVGDKVKLGPEFSSGSHLFMKRKKEGVELSVTRSRFVRSKKVWQYNAVFDNENRTVRWVDEADFESA